MNSYTVWVGNGYEDESMNTIRGKRDAQILRSIIGNRCYAHICAGQAENVLDDVVTISYVPSIAAAYATCAQLRRIGIKGKIGIFEEIVENPSFTSMEFVKQIPAIV